MHLEAIIKGTTIWLLCTLGVYDMLRKLSKSWHKEITNNNKGLYKW